METLFVFVHLLSFLLLQKPFLVVGEEQGYCLESTSESCLEPGPGRQPAILKDDMSHVEFDESSSRDLKEAVIQAHRDWAPCMIPSPPNDSCVTCFDEQIERDLGIWEQYGISEDVINKSKVKGIHYQVIRNKLYRQRHCSFPGRCEGIEYFLLKVVNKLPDTELVINIRDWPQVPIGQKRGDSTLPVFSFSKDSNQYQDILYPAWAFWSGGPALDKYPTGIGNWNKTRNLIKKYSKLTWKEKLNITFFRGSRTSPARDPIIMFSRNFPKFLDAKYTKNQAWKSKADTLGHDPASTVSFEDHCKYKYLLNVRGVAASFRYKHLFLCNSLVLNVDSNWIEFFYPALQPWVHFIPVKEDFSNFHEVFTFITLNDNYARMVSEQAFKFIWNHLTSESVTCYWETLLRKYSKLLNYMPKHDPTLIGIH